MRIKLLGNHSAYHCGCAAVWDALRGELQRAGHMLVDDDFDAVVMNGEGSMHHGRPTFHSKMKALADAISAGRKAYLVNTVWEDNPPDYDDVLRKLNGIVVREEASRADLERHGIHASVAIDASFFAEVPDGVADPSAAGKVLATDFYSRDFNAFATATDGPLAGLKAITMAKTSWKDFVATLRTAKLLVTGRHHAVFAACRARLPFIASEGNTHKVAGLYHSAGVNLPLVSTPAETVALIERVHDFSPEFDRLFDWMEAQSPASIFPFDPE